MTGSDDPTAPGAPPRWFTEALADPGWDGEVTVEGARIALTVWGDAADPVVVLVHGGAAHRGWWAPLAPLLARDHRVVALDLSGHGDSDHRERYHPGTWADEVMAAAQAAGPGRPTVVGHSMGGFVTIVAAAEHGDRLHGAMVLDAPIRRPDPETEEGRRHGRGMFRSPKTYPDLATAKAHFHLVPPQPARNPWLLDHIAEHSLRPVDDGQGGTAWRWKFDPGLFVHRSGPRDSSEYAAKLAAAACRLAYVHGERSAIVDDEVVTYIRELVAGSPAAAAGVPIVEVPDAHHHLLLDEPLATVTAIRALLASWTPVGTPPPEPAVAPC